MTNILTVATFFSGVTAGTLQMSTGADDQNNTLLVASMLWFTSLVFSVGAALNSLLAMAWKATRSYAFVFPGDTDRTDCSLSEDPVVASYPSG